MKAWLSGRELLGLENGISSVGYLKGGSLRSDTGASGPNLQQELCLLL